MVTDVWRKVKDIPNIQVKFGVILKVHHNSAEEEYRVSPLIKGKLDEGRAYFTTDIDDAILTMKVMAKEEWNV